MVLKHNRYLMKRISDKLMENFTKILESEGWAKAVYLMERVDLLKLKERTWKSITQYESRHTWVATDNMGSGFDTRYTDISWMDTR